MPLPFLNRRENQLRLDGRMPLLHWPRFRPSDAETMTFAWWCISICAYAVVVALGMDAFRFLPPCAALLLGADILRWWYRFGAGQWYVPRLRFLAAPWAFLIAITIALPMIAHSTHFTLWWGVVIALLAWRMMRVGQKIRTHYLDYVLEHASLSVATRAKWKALRDTEWRDGQADPNPSRNLDTKACRQSFLNGVRALRGQGRSEIVYAVVAAAVAALTMKLVNDLGYTILRGTGVMVLIAVCITCIGALSALLNRPSGCSLKEMWEATWHALHAFCQSPPSVPAGSRAPWSERSRYGDAENRKAYLVWNMVGITLLVLSATVFYPLISDPFRDRRLGEYPFTGSLMGVRLLELRFDRVLTYQECWLYFGAMWCVPVFFVGTGLMAIVGSTAHGARVLFENDDAIEHERLESPGEIAAHSPHVA